MKRPSLATIVWAFVPFAGVCFFVQAWDRVHPTVLGLPFNLFWLLSWTMLTPLCLWCAYQRMTPASLPGSESDAEERRS
jgi:hypothetical protein